MEKIVRRNFIRKAVLACFFVSGISGLIYEVIWTKMLGLVFGNTTFATSTVLTAYMAGLALGSYLAGRYADKIKNTLKSYAILEIGIGVYCFLVPFLISIMGDLYLSIQKLSDLSFYQSSLVRFAFSFILLLIPTTLMGATLPIFSRFYVEQNEQFGHGVGRVYATNTFGAFLGTILSGFVMIVYLGVRPTINIAVLGNLFAAVICLLIARSQPKIEPTIIPETKAKKQPTKDKESDSISIKKPALIALIIGFGLSGYSAMVYEVAWTRALVMIIGSSTYAFTIMLATFLLGIAIGSFIFSIIAKRKQVNLLWFAVVELLIGFIAIIMLPLFQQAPVYFVDLFATIVRSNTALELAKFLVSAMMMIIPTILLGMLFPMVTQICTKNYSELGSKVGTIYSVNTLGNIVGSFMAGFILIPIIGIQKSIILAGIINIIVGCGILLVYQKLKLTNRAIISFASAIIFVILILVIPSWDKLTMSSGVVIYAPNYSKYEKSERKTVISGTGEKLLFYKEGTDATVSVRERKNGAIVMAVDGKVDASNTGDMYTQMMIAHLPLLLHPDPKTAMVIGLGSGVTLSSAAQHELTQIDCVEIEPAVVEASKFFDGVNRNVLDDPRVKLTVNDGRNYLAASSKKYDVIISEPSNLWLAGIANLFSADFYKLCKQRLNPDGIMCQWSQIYYISPEDLKVVINTFKSVFPNTSIWFSTMGDILMLGSPEGFSIDYLKLEKHYNIDGVRNDLQRLNLLEPLSLMSCYLLDEDGIDKMTDGVRINSDNRPILEYSVPKSLYIESAAESNRLMLAKFKTREFPKMTNFDEKSVTNKASFWYHLGQAYDYKIMPIDARENYEKAISVDPIYVPAYNALALSLYKSGKSAQSAMDYLKKSIEIDPLGSEAYYNLAQIYEDMGMNDEAIANYQTAIKLNPSLKSIYQKKLDELLSKD
jgi:spermidine synthase